MWPFRPEKLTDVLSRDEIRQLLNLGAATGTTLSLVQRVGEDSYQGFAPEVSDAERRQDPFCEYFRHGQYAGKLSFAGADEACARCEQRFVRRLFPPPGAAPLVPDETGTTRHRCHMGLTDWLIPIEVGGRVLGGLLGGRRVETEDDRVRIRKSVGKLGKLTRAEAENAGDHLVVEPADEKARDRLLHEISSIPIGTPEFVRSLRDIGALFSRIATRQFDGVRWSIEDELIEVVETLAAAPVSNANELRRDTERVLEALRERLAVEFVALFALMPRELEAATVNPSLIAASGVAANTSKRLLEIDWARMPAAPADPVRGFLRGVQAAALAERMFISLRDTPPGLRETFSKCIFLYPVEVPTLQRAALVYGPAKSTVVPQDADHRLLARLAKAVSRRYYARAADVERNWIAQRMVQVEESRKKADESRRSMEHAIREAEEARRLEERTRGFTHFNLTKLVEQCVEKIVPAARSFGIEIDSRTLPDRLMYDGDRNRIARALDEILRRCVNRTRTESGAAKPSPVRVLLRRQKDGVTIGAEAVGDWVTGAERRQLFARDLPAPASGSGAAPASTPGSAQGAPTPAPEGAGAGPVGSPAEEATGSSTETAVPDAGWGAAPTEEPVGAVEQDGVAPEGGTDADVDAASAAVSEAVPDAIEVAPDAEQPSGEEPSGAPRGDPGPRAPAAGGQAARKGLRVPPTLRDVLVTVRRHGGRLRLDSERLRRTESDPRLWVARTAFIMDLPAWSLEDIRKKADLRPGAQPGGGASAGPDGAGGAGSGAADRGRRDDRRPGPPRRHEPRPAAGPGPAGTASEAAPAAPVAAEPVPPPSASAEAPPAEAPA